MEGGVTFTLLVSFPEFKGPAGDSVAMTFETTLQEYQDWIEPDGVIKSPETYIEYKYVRPAHTKLAGLHEAIDNLEDKEFDW